MSLRSGRGAHRARAEVERLYPPPAKPPWLWLGNTQTHSPEFLTTATVTSPAPRSRAEGFVGADIDYVPNRGAYAELLGLYQAFVEAGGGEKPTDSPNRFSVCADTAFVFALALEQAGPGASPARLRDALYSVARSDPGDETYSPGQIFDAIRAVRRGVPIDYKGAASECEFRPDGFLTSAPMNIWRVEGTTFNERVRQYADGEVLDVVGKSADGCK